MEAAEALKGLVDRVVELKKGGAPADAVADACRAGTTLLLALRQAYRETALGRRAAAAPPRAPAAARASQQL